MSDVNTECNSRPQRKNLRKFYLPDDSALVSLWEMGWAFVLNVKMRFCSVMSEIVAAAPSASVLPLETEVFLCLVLGE